MSGSGAGGMWRRFSGPASRTEAAGLDVDLLRFEGLDPGFQERVLAEGVEIGGS